MGIDIDPTLLGSLFEMSSEAVIGTQNGVILFANPVARSQLGALVGDSVASVIPENILSSLSDSRSSVAIVNGKSVCISVVHQGDLMLLSYKPSPVPFEKCDFAVAGAHNLQELGSTLQSTRLAIDALVEKKNIREDKELQNYASVLYRDYYRVKRLHAHLSMSCSLLQDTLPYSPALIDLNKLCSDACGTVSYFSQSTGVTVRYQAAEGNYYTVADKALLDTMLLNLLARLIPTIPADSTIEVLLERHKKVFILSMSTPNLSMPETAAFNMDDLAAFPESIGITNLDLNIPRGIVALHGGTLIVESRKDNGACIRIILPVCKAAKINLRTPPVVYQDGGMDNVLTELSMILDKKYYNETMFD